MSDALPLSAADVRDALRKRFETADFSDPMRRPRTLLAYYGTGNEEVVDVEPAGEFRILPVRSEIELRECLPPLEDLQARVAFLVPWPGHLPIDVQGRFAADGKIMRIGREARLQRLFGVTDVDSDAASNPLASYLASVPPQVPMRIAGNRLTVRAMWQTWLHALWSLEVGDRLAGDALLAWAAWNGHGSKFVAAMQQPGTEGVREGLLKFLSSDLKAAAAYVWCAWEEGRGREALEWSLVFEAVAQSDDAAVRMWTKQMALQHCGARDEDEALEIAKLLGAWASGAVRYAVANLHVSETELRAVALAADARVHASEVRAALESSPRLPSGWRQRFARLGRALSMGAEKPEAQHLQAAVAALRTLEGHDYFRDKEQRDEVERAEMATRLLAWLVGDPIANLPEPLSSAGDVDQLGRWYAEQGGYVDRARRGARGGREGAFAEGVTAVLQAVDAVRKTLDRRFARALCDWHAAQRAGSAALPIDKAVERTAVRFMQDDPDRKVLVLLMDGMGWAQAVELLESMAALTPPWGPLAWHTSTAGTTGESAYPIVLANLPTLTDVSRAAFFAGKPLQHGNKPGSDEDVKRWASHPGLRPFFDGSSAPKLMLRGEGHGSEGNLSSAARELVRDSTRRIVAIVVNAIDASLKADSQQRHRWSVNDIRSLPELLEVARESGRTVLFASDHGHVQADVMKNVSAGTAKGRWRPWESASQLVADYEVAVSGPHVWTPKGAHGVVLLADDTTCYGGVSHAGEHGGASLAEVVTPCLLLGCEQLVSSDAALGVREMRVPAWWYHEVAGPLVPDAPARRPRRRSAGKIPAVNVQPALPGLELPKPAQPVTAAPSATFASNKILQAQAPDAGLRAKIVQAVECLRSKGGSCSDGVLAGVLGETSWHIGPALSRVEEALNLDGYPVLRYDRAARQVHLDIGLLNQLFEIEP